MKASWRRIGAMLLRHWYLLSKSAIRLGELVYWPTMQMVMWGYLAKFLATPGNSALGDAAGLLISGVLLWDVLFRSQVGVALSFLEELYSRNLGHLFVSPLRPWELVASMMLMSFARTAFGVGVAASLAVLVHGYSILGLGPGVAALFANLMLLGFAFGLAATALILRFGLAAENFAWGFVFAIAPISGIYYPIAVLPAWLQPIALALPSAHVFEGMRALGRDGAFLWGHFWMAAGLNVIYLGVAALLFLLAYRSARNNGSLLQGGE